MYGTSGCRRSRAGISRYICQRGAHDGPFMVRFVDKKKMKFYFSAEEEGHQKVRPQREVTGRRLGALSAAALLSIFSSYAKMGAPWRRTEKITGGGSDLRLTVWWDTNSCESSPTPFSRVGTKKRLHFCFSFQPLTIHPTVALFPLLPSPNHNTRVVTAFPLHFTPKPRPPATQSTKIFNHSHNQSNPNLPKPMAVYGIEKPEKAHLSNHSPFPHLPPVRHKSPRAN